MPDAQCVKPSGPLHQTGGTAGDPAGRAASFDVELGEFSSRRRNLGRCIRQYHGQRCAAILLVRAMHKAGVKRELEPLAGYSWSLLIVSAAGALALWLSRSLNIPGVSVLAVPAAAVTVFTGLFIIISRRKALTQSLGFLAFENGIALFGCAMHLEYGFFVELGILLDVLVLVFVMGIAVFQISREFEHIDADRLNLLTDTGEVK